MFTFIDSRKRNFWNWNIQELAKWIPSFLDIENEELLLLALEVLRYIFVPRKVVFALGLVILKEVMIVERAEDVRKLPKHGI